jgi:hypothetical protein
MERKTLHISEWIGSLLFMKLHRVSLLIGESCFLIILVKQIGIYTSHNYKGEPTPFYMLAYIMNVVCYKTPFPLMNWSWTPKSPEPIDIYHSKLWEENAKDHFYEIFHNVIIPIHEVLYGNPPPRIFEHIMVNLGAIVD